MFLFSIHYTIINVVVVVNVQFSQETFIGSEASGFVLFNLVLSGGSSAIPFNVTVTPIEQPFVSAEGNIVCIIIMC